MNFSDMAVIFSVALLAGTGCGGAGLLVVYLTAVAGMQQSDAQAVNLIFFISAAAAALPYHARHSRINIRAVIICGVSGALGALCGGALREYVSVETVRRVFGAVLAFTGAATLFSSLRRGQHGKNTQTACGGN